MIKLIAPLLFASTGCVYSPVQVPKFNPPSVEKSDTVRPAIIQRLQKPEYCSTLKMPNPFPKNLNLVIRDGHLDVDNSDANGKILFMEYFRSRVDIKKLLNVCES